MLDTKTLIGRQNELKQIQACLLANKNILLEGPVGVGKTHLATAAAQQQNKTIYRVDGDSRYTEQKLTGWFDPPAVLNKGYSKDTFIPGPLIKAMQEGAILFINELNRLPEGVQNVLLPAIDEKKIIIPHLGELVAAPGFLVIATQNPKEFVATSHLSEALLDRFEQIQINYPNQSDELKIVSQSLNKNSHFIEPAVTLMRATRSDERFKRGASIRAAQSIVTIADQLEKMGESSENAFVSASVLSLANRVEIEKNITDHKAEQELITDLAHLAWQGKLEENLKKKP